MTDPAIRRVTRPRELIERQMAATDSFCTAQHVHDSLNACGTRVGLATVYRNLQMMAEDGRLDTLHLQGETFYRLCADARHHHHIVCRRCGRAVEIEIPGLEQWIAAKTEDLGFSQTTHALEVFGICPQCRALAADGPGPMPQGLTH